MSDSVMGTPKLSIIQVMKFLFMLGNEIGFAEALISEKTNKSRVMSNYANLRIIKDPKQADKMFVFECWQAWQTKPTQYTSKAEFARDMLDKCEYLKRTKTIEDWCRDWEKAHPAR